MTDHVRETLENDAVVVTQQLGPFVAELRYPRGVDAESPWEITVTPFPHLPADQVDGKLTGNMLRRIDFTAAAEERRKIESGEVPAYAMDEDEAREQLRTLRGDAYLAHLALYYVTLVAAGVESVTAKLGDLADLSAATMTDHLKRVRRAGMLTTIRGKAGGQLTEKARELLNEGQ